MDRDEASDASGWDINRTMLNSIRRIVWERQRDLIANPDPTDEWWFLVDPRAEPID